MARRECADPPAQRQREYEHEPERDLVQQQHPIQPRRVIRQPHRGGYDCEFVERPSEAAIQCECPICLLSLASQPYFSSCACALGRGAGERKEKYVWSTGHIRQVFVSHRNAIIIQTIV